MDQKNNFLMKYKYGRLFAHSLIGVDGFLLSLHFPNPKSLGKALRALVPSTIYPMDVLEDNRCTIFLDQKTVHRLENTLCKVLNESVPVVPSIYDCQKCEQATDTVFKVGRFLVCLGCSGFTSPNGNKATGAEREAKRAAIRALKRRSVTNPRRFSYTGSRTSQKSISRAVQSL